MELGALIEPSVRALGYELVGVRYSGGDRRGLMRVYIDSDAGITADDCARVSHQVSGVLDVEDPIPGEYDLEVSSPGLDRPLFNVADYDRFAGETVKVRTRFPLDGRRNFKGRLEGVRGDHVVVTVDGSEIEIPFESVDIGRLVPE